jgi:hypothetical protein
MDAAERFSPRVDRREARGAYDCRRARAYLSRRRDHLGLDQRALIWRSPMLPILNGDAGA